jgi:alginate O-acetyltransferase complex protein AlgI
MLFNSWQFIFVFLPVSFFVYFFLCKRRYFISAKTWLVFASLVFYGYWDSHYLVLLLSSMFLNYAIGTGLAQGYGFEQKLQTRYPSNRKVILGMGIVLNLSLLGYYKYSHFFMINVNKLFGINAVIDQIVLPLAISFFTFTQIVYLVDSYRGETAEYDLLNYMLFVTFFPHLIAGPIVHHKDLMPQFLSTRVLLPRYVNIMKGLFIFAIGLFKKVCIADTFSPFANRVFDGFGPLNFYEAWGGSLAYTFQLYFDFSGYCDMAIGASLLFNIWLPINFNSPYKATDIQDFWRRWHITLSAFLRDYLYIPLGGSRQGEARTYLNLFVTFLLGGLWHGASWMFVLWGALHGGALVIHRIWKKINCPLPTALAWLLTFLFINFTWVFFRAKDFSAARRVMRGMKNVSSLMDSSKSFLQVQDLAWAGTFADTLLRFLPSVFIGQLPLFLLLCIAFVIIACPHSVTLMRAPLSFRKAIAASVLMVIACSVMLASVSSVFLYFSF